MFADKTYGVPPEQVNGSSGVPNIRPSTRLPSWSNWPKVLSSTMVPGKPEGINHFIGRQPFSPSVIPMAIKKCWNGPPIVRAPCFMGLVHHTDAVREYALRSRLIGGQTRQGAR